jgi:hypothetical protein
MEGTCDGSDEKAEAHRGYVGFQGHNVELLPQWNQCVFLTLRLISLILWISTSFLFLG